MSAACQPNRERSVNIAPRTSFIIWTPTALRYRFTSTKKRSLVPTDRRCKQHRYQLRFLDRVQPSGHRRSRVRLRIRQRDAQKLASSVYQDHYNEILDERL